MSKQKRRQGELIRHGVADVPTVIQLEALECGAACLTMILAYFGKWVPLDKVRNDCGVSRDGTNLKNVIKAAHDYGLDAQAYKFEVEDIKNNGYYPCVIHWNFNHFVILDGFKNNKAILNDPARGRYSVTMEQFDKAFTGIAMIFQPTDTFEPGGEKKSILPFAKKKLKGAQSAFALVIITTVITSLIGIITPGFARVFADRLLTGKSPGWFVPFIIGLSLVYFIQITVSVVNKVYTYKINGKIAIVSNSEYMWHALRLPVVFYSQRQVGDIMGRKARNACIANTLIDTFAPLSIQICMMVFYLVVLLRHSWQLTLLGVASVVFNFIMSNIVSNKQTDLNRVGQRDAAKLESSTVAAAQMIDSIKASGSEDGYFEQWSGYQATVIRNTVESTKLSARWALFPDIVSTLLNNIILFGSVILCIRGEWTVGMITAFSGYLISFTAPAFTLAGANQTYISLRTDMERVEDVMEAPTDVEYTESPTDDSVEYDKLSGRIELKNVTFGYSKFAEPLIRDFSMTLEPGQKVAFVGPSGCGKSTLSKLISGLYKPWSGEILFDGKPIDEINHEVFTSSLSVVDQDITLFADTIENNIKMWDSSIEDFEMIMAARDAQIHQDIMMRDGGYRHVITEGGRDLSGGQRQRIEIARVLAEDPRIIIMDEATSALDAKTEYNVVKAIEDRGITCIVVAHRLSTIRDCDEIIVLDRGVVVERGTHEELYAADGVYKTLVSNE